MILYGILGSHKSKFAIYINGDTISKLFECIGMYVFHAYTYS